MTEQTIGRKRKYNTDEERIEARKKYNKAYREKMKLKKVPIINPPDVNEIAESHDRLFDVCQFLLNANHEDRIRIFQFVLNLLQKELHNENNKLESQLDHLKE